jgi:hypothetical protein
VTACRDGKLHLGSRLSPALPTETRIGLRPKVLWPGESSDASHTDMMLAVAVASGGMWFSWLRRCG